MKSWWEMMQTNYMKQTSKSFFVGDGILEGRKMEMWVLTDKTQ